MTYLNQLYTDLQGKGYYVHMVHVEEKYINLIVLSAASATDPDPRGYVAFTIVDIKGAKSPTLSISDLYPEECITVELSPCELASWLTQNKIKKANELSAEIKKYKKYLRQRAKGEMMPKW